jgi:hypothetical protein
MSWGATTTTTLPGKKVFLLSVVGRQAGRHVLGGDDGEVVE